MSRPLANMRAARPVAPGDVEIVEVMGPMLEFLTTPEEEEASACIMRGTIPPGVVIPMHSHPELEIFIQISGAVEGLAESLASDPDRGSFGLHWVEIRPGDIFRVPGDARHAFRNPFPEPSVGIIVTEPSMGRFFREIGTPPGAASSGPPPAEVVRHFLRTAERYGHWNATPEENAAVGISLPPFR